MLAKAVKQHKWLEQMVGEWVFEVEAQCKPGEPAMKWKGKERVRSFGGLWVMMQGKVEMPGGGTGETLMTLGYDPDKKRFVGTWVGTMMHTMWVYVGELKGKTLRLSTEGPSWQHKGKTAKYRDEITLEGKNARRMDSFVQEKGGKWQKMMTARYRRK